MIKRIIIMGCIASTAVIAASTEQDNPQTTVRVVAPTTLWCGWIPMCFGRNRIQPITITSTQKNDETLGELPPRTTQTAGAASRPVDVHDEGPVPGAIIKPPENPPHLTATQRNEIPGGKILLGIVASRHLPDSPQSSYMGIATSGEISTTILQSMTSLNLGASAANPATGIRATSLSAGVAAATMIQPLPHANAGAGYAVTEHAYDPKLVTSNISAALAGVDSVIGIKSPSLGGAGAVPTALEHATSLKVLPLNTGVISPERVLQYSPGGSLHPSSYISPATHETLSSERREVTP